MTGISITFHGATLRVTGSCTLVQAAGKKILVDCGLIQGDADADELNHAPFPFKPAELDAVVLTHAHLDHTGRLPLLTASGFNGPVYTHGASAALAELVWLDSARLSSQEEDEPLYDDAQVQATVGLLKTVRYEESFQVGPVQLTLFDAGHIIGSAHVLIEAEGKALLMSGDIGVTGTPIIRDPTFDWKRPIDGVVIESTYGDRSHRGRDETIEQFAAILRQAQDRKGMVLIPSFAIGRTQELLFHFHQLVQSGKLPSLPVVLDSPMAEKATGIYRAHQECYDKETWDMLQRGDLPMTFPDLRELTTPEQSKQVKDIKPPAVIIAGSGMCTGGRIMHHLKNFLDKESTTVIFVGFQGNGTLGRRLVEGAKKVHIQGQEIAVRARVETLNGFSAHADQTGLRNWAKRIPGPPKSWWINHGEEQAAKGLQATLTGAGLAGAQVADPGRLHEI